MTNLNDFYHPPIATSPLGRGDHNIVLLKPKHQLVMNKTTKREIRSMTDSNIRSFGQWVTKHQWEEVLEVQGTQNKTTAFYRTLNQAIETYFPYKVIRTYTQDKPWMSQKIKDAIKARQQAFNAQNWVEWRSLRNKVQYAIKRARKQFYNTRIKKLKTENPSAWFSELKVLTGTQRKDMTVPVEGVNPENNDEIANIINCKFSNVTTSLPPLDLSELPAFLPSRPPPTVQPWEMYEELKKVKTSQSPGPDGGRLLREFACEIVPQQWKEAVVVPLPKTRPPCLDQLRPVSLTSLVAKDDLDSLSRWTIDKKMKLNPDKCKTMQVCFSRNPPPPPTLNIDGHQLAVVSVAKCLGVSFQADLNRHKAAK
ncbi:Hypp9295 [Branchiostoma lanceolatum]|uniref:Hypp9295 protein n=1 Tax=Branchiostoma lanceolatum TaxID=7740 RepID=A0A8K0EKU6_BRALA|nr:Hypp9295 [Branchiostoma lanceolatum]